MLIEQVSALEVMITLQGSDVTPAIVTNPPASRAFNLGKQLAVTDWRLCRRVVRAITQQALRTADNYGKRSEVLSSPESDGTVDSICHRCFVTVATEQTESDLPSKEYSHACNRAVVERYLGLARQARRRQHRFSGRGD
jgi:pyocin large subunit-like protein